MIALTLACFPGHRHPAHRGIHPAAAAGLGGHSGNAKESQREHTSIFTSLFHCTCFLPSSQPIPHQTQSPMKARSKDRQWPMLKLKNKIGRKRHLNLGCDLARVLHYFYSGMNYSVANWCCAFPCSQHPFLPPARGHSPGSQRSGGVCV